MLLLAGKLMPTHTATKKALLYLFPNSSSYSFCLTFIFCFRVFRREFLSLFAVLFKF